MRVLITGVAGFVGSNLAGELLSENHEVIGVDNLSYGNLENVQELISNKRFTFINKDLKDYASIENIEVEKIIHLASQKIPRYSNSLITLEENHKMTDNVINKCIKENAHLLFASTSDVYGKNPNYPYNENSDFVIGPSTIKRWAYAVSKIYSEHKIIAHSEAGGLKYTIMRFFGSYGPKQNRTWWGGPQSVFIQNILENKRIEIHGDGKQTRTFTYISDLVHGIILCLKQDKAINSIYNIAGNPNEEISILNLAERINGLMGKQAHESLIDFIPYESFGKYEDVRRRLPDISKIKSELGYKPSISLDEGLKRTIDWQTKKFRK